MGHDLDTLQEKAQQTMLWLYLTMQGALDDEGAVFIESTISDLDVVAFKVKVAAGDLGKAIGKQGRNARALRTLLSARGGKDGVRYALDLEADAVAAERVALLPTPAVPAEAWSAIERRQKRVEQISGADPALMARASGEGKRRTLDGCLKMAAGTTGADEPAWSETDKLTRDGDIVWQNESLPAPGKGKA